MYAVEKFIHSPGPGKKLVRLAFFSNRPPQWPSKGIKKEKRGFPADVWISPFHSEILSWAGRVETPDTEDVGGGGGGEDLPSIMIRPSFPHDLPATDLECVPRKEGSWTVVVVNNNLWYS